MRRMSEQEASSVEGGAQETRAGVPASAESGDSKMPRVWPWHRAWWTRDHLVGVLWAGGAFVVVTVAGTMIEGLFESTGVFGPTVDALIAKQQENFDDLRGKLDELAKSDDPKEQAKLRKEIEALIARQEQLTQRTHVELREYQSEAERARAEALAEKGSAGGADFWVALNESATVGEREHVIAVTGITGNNTYIQVNYQNQKRYMYPGDALEVQTEKGAGKVIFKSAKDGRAGFDWVPPGA